jgi:hypothetical protein
MAGVQRWTQLDLESGGLYDPLSLNRYLYMECDPANRIDPDGRSVECFLINLFRWH